MILTPSALQYQRSLEMLLDGPNGGFTSPHKAAQRPNTNGTLDKQDFNQATFATERNLKMSENLFAVLCFRNLIYDICMQNGGGHAGSAVGMAAIGVALWKYVMRYNPADPDWFDRDRFVLSNGTLLLQRLSLLCKKL